MNIQITEADCQGQANPVTQGLKRKIPTRPLAIIGNKVRIGRLDVPLPEWVCVRITDWRGGLGMKAFSFTLAYEQTEAA